MDAEPLGDWYIHDSSVGLRRSGGWLLTGGLILAGAGVCVLLMAATTWSGYVPQAALAIAGGLGIAALTGVILAAVGSRVPLVIDGFITGAAALVATALEPGVAPRLIAAHRSPEPGHAVILDRLGLEPLLDLQLRLGEGSGAALALSLLDAAVAIRDEMATFDSAGVAGPSGT